MSVLKKIEIIVQETGYSYVIDGNGIAIREPAVSFRERNDYIQISGGACPISPNLVPDINRAKRYFEKRNANFKYGQWIMSNGNHFVLVGGIPTSNFNSLSKDEVKGLIKCAITEFSKENDAVMLDLMMGNI